MDENNNNNSKISMSTGILGDIARYYRDFLDTDFKKTRLPKRQIARIDNTGNLVGIGIEKYTTLIEILWKQLSKPINENFEVTFGRARHTSKISQILTNLIDKHIKAIKSEQLDQLKAKSQEISRLAVAALKDDPDALKDKVYQELENLMAREIATPLINHLEPYFKGETTSAFESLFDIEGELCQRLLDTLDESIGHALNSAVIDKSFTEVDELFSDLYQPSEFRKKLNDYFGTFSANDFYAELIELMGTLNIKENMDIYLYIGDINFNHTQYPLFYIPMHIQHHERKFTLTVDPHLYINKKAVDYIGQEVARQNNKRPPILVKDRILFLESKDNFVAAMQDKLDFWVTQLGLRNPIDLNVSRKQKSHSSEITISNRLHFAAFDKSDESLLNDYEELLTAAEEGSDAAREFEEVIREFLYENPVSVVTETDTEWMQTSVDERLIFRSPIPLNEEQRKIIMAVNKKDCRLVEVEGPPGTGKSHCISTIAFEAILNGKNILILSDKNEALDVVFDKITSVLSSVRGGEDFVDPILRIGKTNNTYHKIVSAQSIDKLRKNTQIAESKKGELTGHINSGEKNIKDCINTTINAYQKIDVQEVYNLHQLEKTISEEFKDYESLINDPEVVSGLMAIRLLISILNENNKWYFNFFRSIKSNLNIDTFKSFIHVQPALPTEEELNKTHRQSLKLFNSFNVDKINILRDIIQKYFDIKMPLFGFFFKRPAARMLDSELGDTFDCKSALDAHRVLDDYITAHQSFSTLKQIMKKRVGDTESFNIVFQQVSQDIVMPNDKLESFTKVVAAVEDVFVRTPELKDILHISPNNISAWIEDSVINQKLDKFFVFVAQYNKFRQVFESIPVFDYTGDKTKLETLHTQSLANKIDKRVVDFVENKRTVAKEIRDIISKKRKFPLERFQDLKEAFPCIIANIRDYSEYMPLEKGIFDIVIIDEASQVSIAQAFPAIIRAKKMIVLGDSKQFSNVKTANASKEINAQYLHSIRDNYLKSNEVNESVLNRLEYFNVKTSILSFVSNISNYNGLLKKHFRGYPEIISFSSKFFYGGDLQAVKVRSKPIEDVIEFTVLPDDELESVRGNANENEAEYILKELEKLIVLDEPPSVGIITPFTDMQKYCAHYIQKSSRGFDIFEKLHLKIMTFDSCQGEERDICFYPLVATKVRNRLSSIFPKDLEHPDDVSETLRLQRLNVGFSRAKEKIHFVLSMPLEDYHGSISTVLRHYQRELEIGKSAPTSADVDPKSPMEAKVLTWLTQTQFYQRHKDNVEIIPQFPVGEYLKQLDHTYSHPMYRLDFLVKLRAPDTKKMHFICIEYDGFKEHFTNLEKVDALNYEHYYKADDVEREKILESYGYKFLRINRFNLGKDPVVTLSERLSKLSNDMFKTNSNHKFIDKMQSEHELLSNGEMKVCSKCCKPKSIKEFEDKSLKSGVGRICKKCKR